MCYGAKNYSRNGPMAHFCCRQAEGERHASMEGTNLILNLSASVQDPSLPHLEELRAKGLWKNEKRGLINTLRWRKRKVHQISYLFISSTAGSETSSIIYSATHLEFNMITKYLATVLYSFLYSFVWFSPASWNNVQWKTKICLLNKTCRQPYHNWRYKQVMSLDFFSLVYLIWPYSSEKKVKK